MLKPKVSICVPTFNGEAFLEEALASIKAQTYRPLEVIISDDNSADKTISICEKFKKNVDFPVKIVAHEPTGIGANWNNTLKFATGYYIKFLFQDDILSNNCVTKMVEVMLKNPEVGIVGCKRKFIVESQQESVYASWIEAYGNLQKQIEKNDSITFIDKSLFSREDFLSKPRNKIGEPSTVLFKKDLLKYIKPFDEDLKQILDYVFYYRALKQYPIVIINEPLVTFRLHSNQATNINNNRNISDYEIYDQILYNEFFPLLHKSQQNRLRNKFSKYYRFKNQIIKKIKKAFG